MKKLFAIGMLIVIYSAGYGQVKKAAAKPVVIHPGKKIYDEYCLSCHQEDGMGVPGMNPPLSKTEWVLGD